MEINKLFNIDCMELMSQCQDKSIDLAVVDPNYGIKQAGGTNKSRGQNVRQKNGTKIFVEAKDYKPYHGNDEEPPPIGYFDELFRVSKNQIIFGVNYFSHYQFGPGRIVWDKVNGNNDFSDCEIAYCSFHDSVRIFRYMWNGMMQGMSIAEGHIMQGNKALNEKRIHPNQKPVALYKWIIMNYAKPGYKILDTHAGSCSSLIACYDLGFNYIASEIDTHYWDIGTERIREHKAQLRIDYN